MATLELNESPKGYFTMQGELNRNSIPKSDALVTLLQSSQNTANGELSTLDMSGVIHSDTAGLAWLMNFLKHNQQQNVHVQLKNVPESLINLAKISDVDSFLSVQ